MSDDAGLPPATASPTPAAPDNSFLGKLNTSLTAIAAIVSAIAAMLAHGAKDEAASAKGQATAAKVAVKDFEERQRAVEANYKFTGTFMDSLKNDIPNDPEGRKRFRAILAALDIVAKASINDEGDSPAEQRAALPILMALALDDAGSVAVMDSDLTHLDRWMLTPLLDTDEKTRLTAVRALFSICRLASRHRDMARVEKGSNAISELLDFTFVAKDVESVIFRADTLLSILKFRQILEQTSKVTDPPSTEATLGIIRSQKDDAINDLNQLNNGIDPEDGQPLLVALTPKQKEQVAKLLRSAKIDRAQAVDDQEKRITGIAGTTVDQEAINTKKNDEITNLLSDLKSTDTITRRAARAKLALYGQDAVAPLFTELARHPITSNSEDDYKSRLGIATALRNLRQPVRLELDQIKAAIDLFKSNDPDTRLAILDFFINLEDSQTINLAFDELVDRVTNSDPKQDGNVVINAVTAIAGWRTALQDEVVHKESGKKIKDIAQERLLAWQKDKKFESAEWDQTRKRINLMIKKGNQ